MQRELHAWLAELDNELPSKNRHQDASRLLLETREKPDHLQGVAFGD